MEAEKRGETGTWELRNGADEENKGLDTRYKTSCDRSCYETLPCLLNLRDRECVWDTENETANKREREGDKESMWESKAVRKNSLVWAQEHLSSKESSKDNWLRKTNSWGIQEKDGGVEWQKSVEWRSGDESISGRRDKRELCPPPPHQLLIHRND